ncbi:RNA 3'-terminal phosphate cyclase [Corallincola luteus]|uniref:RNA 3'-terminal phosphate cyclase n=1 Tax=Corallincola luteus TaxID=1775177 RepID=A0ABY2AM23_9GAMM|nr:RNA 3'-terminal phosphate cyclase [Corallincola luteus]TCI03991.1 RNA 3'-terminal phosphate cyclase [Corallincola luteus]
MSYLIIDGSQGEGGGQVLRTALTLSILTQQNIELINIRAGRKKTGLLRQHLTSVLAAQKICDAKTEGVELGATRIRFAPGQVKSGNFHFAIGTAGSTVLVCQTILPVLALAKGHSTVTFEGGTHNGMSPSLCFLQRSYLPVLARMGVECDVQISALGFYPAGGGKWQLNIAPTTRLRPCHLTQAGADVATTMANCSANALISQLSESIGQREITTAKKALGWQEASSEIRTVMTPGPGNSFQLCIDGESHRHLFEVVGELGVSAERVAKRAVGRVNKFVHAQAAVEEHLADQLLLPMVLAGNSSFTTTKPSLHTVTNIDVIRQILGVKIKVEQIDDLLWRIHTED